MSKKTKIGIIGAGPAGLFSAMQLIRNLSSKNISISIFDKGLSLEDRTKNIPCLKNDGICKKCNTCKILCGFGGSGLINDGKLVFSKEFGGNLQDILTNAHFNMYEKLSKGLYLSFIDGHTNGWYRSNNFPDWKRKVNKAGLDLLKGDYFHLGSDRALKVLESIYTFLKKDSRVDFRFGHDVLFVNKEGNRFSVQYYLEKADEHYTDKFDYLIVSPGRLGNSWFTNTAIGKSLDYFISPLDIGVRVELPYYVVDTIAKDLYEFKI